MSEFGLSIDPPFSRDWQNISNKSLVNEMCKLFKFCCVWGYLKMLNTFKIWTILVMKVYAITGSAKQHDPPSGNKIITTRVAVVWDMVWWCFQAVCQNHWLGKSQFCITLYLVYCLKYSSYASCFRSLFLVLFSSDCCSKGSCFVLKFIQLILMQKRMLQLYFHCPIYVCFFLWHSVW